MFYPIELEKIEELLKEYNPIYIFSRLAITLLKSEEKNLILNPHLCNVIEIGLGLALKFTNWGDKIAPLTILKEMYNLIMEILTKMNMHDIQSKPSNSQRYNSISNNPVMEIIQITQMMSKNDHKIHFYQEFYLEYLQEWRRTFKDDVKEILSIEYDEIDENVTQFKNIIQINLQRFMDNVRENKDNFSNFDFSTLFDISGCPNTAHNVREKYCNEPGKNKEFLSDQTAINQILEKPIVKYKDHYYIIPIWLFSQNLHLILENQILSALSDQKKTKYHNRKAKMVENLTAKFFNRVFRQEFFHDRDGIYSSLYYSPDVSNPKNVVEADLIIVFDKFLLIGEIKDIAFPESTDKFNFDKIKSFTKKSIGKAFEQAKRTEKFIQNSSNPKFYNKAGDLLLDLTGITFEKVFKIHVSGPSLGIISTQINNWVKLGMIEEEIWSLYLLDLAAITDICQNPMEFLLYLDRRMRLIKQGNMFTEDELDYFGAFLSMGLFFSTRRIKRFDFSFLDSQTQELDSYYLQKMGNSSNIQKPFFNYSIKPLIAKILQKNNKWRSWLCFLLINLADESQSEILNGIFEAYQLSSQDRRAHRITEPLKEYSVVLNFIVSFLVIPEIDIGYRDMKRYQLKADHWFDLRIIYQDNTNFTIDFTYSYIKYVHNDRMDQITNKYFKNTKARAVILPPKFGRNQLCPCGSGLKYKKCCLISGKRNRI